MGSFLALIVCISTVSCDNDKSETKDPMVEDTTKGSVKREIVKSMPENGTFDGDTLNVTGKHVLFFYPSSPKAKSLNLNDQEIGRFKSTAQSIIDSIGVISPGVTASMTELGHVRIFGRKGSPMIISLTTFSEPFGMVISDGTQMAPITKGARPREAYLEQIRRVLNFETSGTR
ncbi:MAG: hypothetical protein RL090_1132 [Bacteroidota bacterium]